MAEAGRYPPWDRSAFNETLRSAIERAAPVIMVADTGVRAVGFLSVTIHGYAAARGLFLVADAIYVTPAYRGSRAAAALLDALSDLATRTGAREVFMTAGSVSASEAAKIRWLRRFGFAPYGATLRRAL